MATTKLKIVNGALSLLSLPRTQGLADIQQGAEIVNNYDDVVEDRFASYAWRWASESAKLQSVSGNSALNNNWSVYEKPVGALLVSRVWQEGSTDMQLTYEINKEGIHAISDTDLYALFVRRQPETEWPAYFSRLVEVYLALEASYPFAPDRQRALANEARVRDNIARNTDSKNRGGNVRLFDCDDFIDARVGIGGEGEGPYDYGIYSQY